MEVRQFWEEIFKGFLFDYQWYLKLLLLEMLLYLYFNVLTEVNFLVLNPSKIPIQRAINPELFLVIQKQSHVLITLLVVDYETNEESYPKSTFKLIPHQLLH